jgi:hypothetical protein
MSEIGRCIPVCRTRTGGGEGGEKDWTGLDSLGVYLSRVEGWYRVAFAMASFLLLKHLIRLLCEPHKPFAKVLHPRVRVVLWSVIVLWEWEWCGV